MIAAIRFQIDGESYADLYTVGEYGDIDWDNECDCQLGEDYHIFYYNKDKTNQGKTENIKIAKGLDGKYILRVIETKRYIFKVSHTGQQDIELPIIQNENNKFLKIERDDNALIFQFINYLGRTKALFHVKDYHRYFAFEVVPNKIDYEDDYIELTESIAEKCSELLLEYSGATSNLFSLSDGNSKTLLEQFIFLRRFCYSENILGIFESIKRNPDRILIENNEFKPIGTGKTSKKLFTHPFQYGKKWQQYKTKDGMEHYLPSIVAVTHKEDSLDTVANRFLKFALEKFRNICEELVRSLQQAKAKKQTECLKEAKSIKKMLDDILHDRFFDDIGQMIVLPQNNQVLQKRTGYSEVFAGYSMVDLALQLDWRGNESVYDGESKNVALLYEYWIFFELFDAIKSLDGCRLVSIKSCPFINNDCGLTISLSEGKKSCQGFVVESLDTRINLYYNRTFKREDFRTTKYEESYSHPFRPDYTLAIFPYTYEGGRDGGESAAIKDGAVTYIHFDAKYRISSLTDIIGNDKNNADEEELSVEKANENTNTYKIGDLLKMHTYNDAIRRTIGSYVLYPGSGNINTNKCYSRFDEILPGVGAFAIKPSTAENSKKGLSRFIRDLIEANRRNQTRLNRMRYYDEIVIQEPSIKDNIITNINKTNDESRTDILCVIGYIRADNPKDYYYSLIENSKLKTGQKFLFYYYAIKGKTVYSHHRDIAKARFFRFYKNNIGKTGSYELEPYFCEILSANLVSRHTLVEELKKNKCFMTEETSHSADFYYVIEVKVLDDSYHRDSINMNDINRINGNDSFSPHSPKIIKL